jgi:hypothetical protein
MRAPVPPCVVCTRPSRGFGWFDPLSRRRPRPSVRFCSMPCQAFWCAAAERSLAMVDLTEQEQEAIRAAMRRVAEAMDEIGWSTRLQDLTEAQVLTLIEVSVGGFQEAMQAIARGQPTEEVPF